MNPQTGLREKKKMDGGWRKGGMGEPQEAAQNKGTLIDCKDRSISSETAIFSLLLKYRNPTPCKQHAKRPFKSSLPVKRVEHFVPRAPPSGLQFQKAAQFNNYIRPQVIYATLAILRLSATACRGVSGEAV